MSGLISLALGRLRAALQAVGGIGLIGSGAWYARAVQGFNAAGVPDGASIIFMGRGQKNDGGGGVFTYDKTGVQTVDGGTVFAPAGGGRLIRSGWTVFGFNGPASVAFWGARNDGADSGGLALAVAAANASPMDLQLLPGDNAVSATLNLSVKYKILGGKVSTLKAIAVMSAIVTIGAGQLGAQDNNASNYQMGGLDGVSFDANARAANCAVYAGGEYVVTGYSTKECKFFNATGDGVRTLNNFFVCQFYSCAFHNNAGNGFRLGQGNNSGENIAFYSCGFFNNGLSGFYAENAGPGGATVFMFACTYDYNQNWGIENGTNPSNATVISMFGGHIEQSHQYILNYGTMSMIDVDCINGSDPSALGYLIDNQSGMTIKGGWLQGDITKMFSPTGKPVLTDRVIGIPESFPMMRAPAGIIETGTVYRNTVGRSMHISVPISFGAGAGAVRAWAGITGVPEFLVGSMSGNTNAVADYLSIVVPAGYYYKFVTTGSALIEGGRVESFG